MEVLHNSQISSISVLAAKWSFLIKKIVAGNRLRLRRFAANSCRGFIFPERKRSFFLTWKLRERATRYYNELSTNFSRSATPQRGIMQIMDWIPLYEIKLWKIYTLRFHARQILWNDTSKTLWNSKPGWDLTRRPSSRSADVVTTERDIKRTLSWLNAGALCA